jgi:hypothetical protein
MRHKRCAINGEQDAGARTNLRAWELLSGRDQVDSQELDHLDSQQVVNFTANKLSGWQG